MRALILTLLVTAALAGCVDDAPSETGSGDEAPTAPSASPSFNNTQPATTAGLAFVAQLTYDNTTTPFPSGSGIWVHGDYVFGSALGNGFFIADISDPEHPVLVYNATVDQDEANNTVTSFARDADVVEHPDGRLTLVLATQSNGMHIWDVTDPTQPEFLAIADVPNNHNIAVVPGTTYVFNSQSGGEGRTNDLIDLTDPAHPVVLGAFGNHGCHDITFFGKLGDEKFRAYCAGIQRTEIWDMDKFDAHAAAFNINVIGTVEATDNPLIGSDAFGSYPARTLHHLAMVNEDASILIIGDEYNGGGEPGACFTPGGAPVTTPFGALWFYDLSDETSPELLNWISGPLVMQDQSDVTAMDPTDPTGASPNCTAHFGSLVPGEEKIVMAWYSAGVVVIDFSGVSTQTPPTILAQYQPDPTNPWDARISNGYVFTGDIVRGMDVLKLV